MALKKFGYDMAEEEAADIIKSHSNASDMYIRFVKGFFVKKYSSLTLNDTQKIMSH